MIRIEGAPADVAARWWPRVAEGCEAALAYSGGLLALADVQAAVAARDMQLWIVLDDDPATDDPYRGVCVTEVATWPRARVLTVVITAGEGALAWADALDAHLALFAAAQGCTRLMSHSRRGVTPHMRARGWKDLTTTFIKELSHGQ